MDCMFSQLFVKESADNPNVGVYRRLTDRFTLHEFLLRAVLMGAASNPHLGRSLTFRAEWLLQRCPDGALTLNIIYKERDAFLPMGSQVRLN